MPRHLGQVDVHKTDAILDAAGEVFAARGLSASIDEVARRACVSKQTIYNRYGSKTELVRAMVRRRVDAMAEPLHGPDPNAPVEEVLALYARRLMEQTLYTRALTIMQVTMQAAGHMPEMARAVFEAGPRANRRALAAYLAEETCKGRLEVGDPMEAAEFFAGMVVTTRQMAALMGAEIRLDSAQLDHISQEAAMRFVRAYAPRRRNN
jgi:AcrR family transcriptional regulator